MHVELRQAASQSRERLLTGPRVDLELREHRALVEAWFEREGADLEAATTALQLALSTWPPCVGSSYNVAGELLAAAQPAAQQRLAQSAEVPADCGRLRGHAPAVRPLPPGLRRPPPQRLLAPLRSRGAIPLRSVHHRSSRLAGTIVQWPA